MFSFNLISNEHVHAVSVLSGLKAQFPSLSCTLSARLSSFALEPPMCSIEVGPVWLMPTLPDLFLPFCTALKMLDNLVPLCSHCRSCFLKGGKYHNCQLNFNTFFYSFPN